MDRTDHKMPGGNVLIVDDDLSERQTLAALLEREGYVVRCAPSGQTGLLFAREDPPELIMLDVLLPDMDGFQLCRRLKEDPRISGIPVIYISALEEVKDKIEGFAAGGVDYIFKPVQAEEVLVRVRSHLTLQQLRNQLEVRVEERTAELLTANEKLVATNEQLLRESEQREQAEEALKERLRFEHMLSDLSAALVSRPGDEVEAEIKTWVLRLGEFFEVDRCNVGLLSEDKTKLIHSYEYHSEEVEPTTDVFTKEELPWYMEQLSQGRSVAIHRVDDFPEEAERERQRYLAHGIRSILSIPLESGGKILGSCTFISIRAERFWSDDMIQRLRLATDVLSNALSRNRAEHDLREAELEHRTILDFTYDWEYWANPDGTLRYVSPSCERITGYTPWEFLTMPTLLREIIVEEDRGDWAEHLGQAHRTHHEVEIQFRIRRRDGGIRWIEHVCRPVWRADGAFLGLRVSNRDITERMDMQERIRLDAEEWQTTFDSVHDPIMLMDSDYRIRRVNAATAAFLDLPVDQILGCTCHLLMHGTQAPVDGCPSAKVFQTQHHEVAEVFHPGKNLWLLVSADPIQDAAGNVTGVVHMVKDITERKRMQEELETKLREIEGLKHRLETENITLREEVKKLSDHSEIVGRSEPMQKVLAQVEQVARTDSTVLILGETGTGKEPMAQAIHQISPRKDRPLITVNCASLPPSLIESELFGRERGAYTGALTSMVGRFEAADKGTLFLDEIGDLPPEVQAKLLRVLEQGEFERLGSSKTLRTDVRIIAATNQDLAQEVKAGRFRRDLFYRLNVFPILIPPLRERPEDIPLLIWAFVKKFEVKMSKRIESIPKRTMEAMLRYPWPGNVRELRNVVERAMIMSDGRVLDIGIPATEHLDSSVELPANASLEEVERQHILDVLQKTGWRITGKGGAAEVLGLKRTTLQSRMGKLGIKRPTSDSASRK